jgi:hypothetical protein
MWSYCSGNRACFHRRVAILHGQINIFQRFAWSGNNMSTENHVLSRSACSVLSLDIYQRVPYTISEKPNFPIRLADGSCLEEL